ncbi:RNA polymerase sigma-70 factor [Parasegetibacter sp. NRK P23]|uniref:RNA polymerase sigma-70 factor n=1 Tax=Parasegetibacter sp. NRK P23 TaxID=2942999 RepID=UPI0020449445|nr:RNA polymerase sigma-70 factor [Parasegetibacter sp. NRK P23]MCM5527871.1 RNA polymerase sigma-70 factor [Parasegetibacter sp. NRK P23]
MNLSEHDIRYLQTQIARNDDQLAYKSLFKNLQPWLYQFAYSFIKSHELAEEIVSDVFIRIWEKRKQLEQIDNLKLYLYVSTKNFSLNYLQKLLKNKTFELDQLSVELKSLYADPEQVLITREMANRVRLAVNQLPPRCKMIFKLVKEDGLKYKEVAELLDISIKTVEAQVTLAVKKLGSTIRFDLHRTTPTAPGSKK